MRQALSTHGVYLAWVIALAATLGSLYFSEVRELIPCELCWYQRIFMYPLAIILGIAAYRNDPGIGVYTAPLAWVGAAIAAFHYLLQMVPLLGSLATCGGGVPCTEVEVEFLGFITLPLLSLVAFVAIGALLRWAARSPQPASPPRENEG